MKLSIVQGNNHSLHSSDVNVVIDVIRAFTVSHLAFLKGAEKIILVGTEDEAFALKKSHRHFLLSGEIKGLPIPGFDLSNSPKEMLMKKVGGKTLVQKTTNGVAAALHSLCTKYLLVTGFTNAKTTAQYVKKICESLSGTPQVNLIASHPTGDDDLACAQYMEQILLENEAPPLSQITARIKSSHVAEKFFDKENRFFDPDDILLCIQQWDESFVMQVNPDGRFPVIERKEIK
ncbi:2-phosphosulfolactate phosphatase [Halalkalibacterium ligniniphilum]|uniref:2-phosphosulfolactate phosphatase n=1 Tax=Halalkalibacterium ligniniphilum TaxID=1134413 RepID=UPI0003473C5B|nr:2-phosphosulfolactate phosphatase [Halalkalibacterium ligniniphilum]